MRRFLVLHGLLAVVAIAVPASAQASSAHGRLAWVDAESLVVRDVATGAEERLALPAPAAAPAWSPSGRWIALQEESGFAVADVVEGTVERFAPGRSPAWSPDGTSVVVSVDTGLELVALSRARRALAGTAPGDLAPAWSSDGETIAFIRPQEQGRHELWVVDAAGGAAERVGDAVLARRPVAWSPQGRRLAWFRPRDGGAETELVIADLTDRVAAVVVSNAFRNTDSVAWSPDGARVAFSARSDHRDGGLELWSVAANGTALESVAQFEGDAILPSWSPDGRTIAFTGVTPKPQPPVDGHPVKPLPEPDVYLVPAAGGERTRVTDTGEVWSGTFAPPLAAPHGFDGDPATTERVAHDDATSAAIVLSQVRFARGAAPHVVLARDDVFADALAAAPLSADAPLLLTGGDDLDEPTRREIRRVLDEGARVYVLGGAGALGAGVTEDLRVDGYEVVRLAGPTRVETALEIAATLRTLRDDRQPVVLARAYGSGSDPTAAWADSITGGAWAAATGSLVLVTPTDELHPAVREALARWRPAATVIVGGPAAVSKEVEGDVAEVTGGLVERVAGPNRAATAVAIARELFGGPGDAFALANGYDPAGWAHALAGAGTAAGTNAPILLVESDGVPPETREHVPIVCFEPGTELLLLAGSGLIGDAVREALDARDGVPCPGPSPA